MREKMPSNIRSLIGRCEVGEIAFDNDDMSEALHFGEQLFELSGVGKELASQITRAIVSDQPLDRMVLRHWANRFHDKHREAGLHQ